jgi:hypothetical protein
MSTSARPDTDPTLVPPYDDPTASEVRPDGQTERLTRPLRWGRYRLPVAWS